MLNRKPPKPIIYTILLICFSFMMTEIAGFKECQRIAHEQHNVLHVFGVGGGASGIGMTYGLDTYYPTISQGRECGLYKFNGSPVYMHQEAKSIFNDSKQSSGSKIRPAGILLGVCFLFLINCCWEISAKRMNTFNYEGIEEMNVDFAEKSAGGDYGDNVYRPTEFSIPASAENGNSLATTFTVNTCWIITITATTTSFLLYLLPVVFFA